MAGDWPSMLFCADDVDAVNSCYNQCPNDDRECCVSLGGICDNDQRRCCGEHSEGPDTGK